MITNSTFTQEELEILRFGIKDTKHYLLLFIKVFAPLSFLIGLLGLLKKGYGYLPTTLAIMAIFLFVSIYLAIKEKYEFRKDLKEQIKLTGSLIVVKKSQRENDHIIYTNSNELKKVNVHFASVFNQINEGDDLYIEIAKSSKHIFKLSKGDTIIINGG